MRPVDAVLRNLRFARAPSPARVNAKLQSHRTGIQWFFGKNSNHTEFDGAGQHLKGPEVGGSLHDPVAGDAAHRWTARDVSGQDDHICLG